MRYLACATYCAAPSPAQVLKSLLDAGLESGAAEKLSAPSSGGGAGMGIPLGRTLLASMGKAM